MNDTQIALERVIGDVLERFAFMFAELFGDQGVFALSIPTLTTADITSPLQDMAAAILKHACDEGTRTP